MTAHDDRGEVPTGAGTWSRRLLDARFVLTATALVLLGFVLTGALSAVPALVGMAVILVAAALFWGSSRPAGRDAPSALPPAVLGDADPVLDVVLAGIPDPVIALDRDGNVVAFNDSATAVAPALRRGEPASLTLRMPDVVEAVRRARSSGETQEVEFYERVPVDRWFQAVVTPVNIGAHPSSGPALVLMTFRDLTPLHRVEEMRADFVANASHELRTPLAALSGFIDTLQGPARNDPAARERFLPIMQAQATRMARLIDDLLSLSRIELSAHVRPETRVDVVPIVRQVADGLQTLARDRDVKVDVQAPSGVVVVLGDRDELLRVFENLIENALKYAASGKRVDIVLGEGRTPDGGPEARVAVRDYGPGIPPEHLPRLTERFYRVDAGESRAQGGTGLGLALVKHILNRHRGRLTIESPPGAGATFTVHLPLSPAGR